MVYDYICLLFATSPYFDDIPLFYDCPYHNFYTMSIVFLSAVYCICFAVDSKCLVASRIFRFMGSGVIPKSLPVLSAESILRKAAVDRGIRFSIEQYGCRQRDKVNLKPLEKRKRKN